MLYPPLHEACATYKIRLVYQTLSNLMKNDDDL